MKARGLLSLTLACGLVAAIGGLAWACTVQPQLLGLSRHYGPAGTTISMKGQALWAYDAPARTVEIRWNSINGAKIGETVVEGAGPFSLSVTIPNSKPGVYSLLLTVKAPSGQTEGVARAAFEVTASSSSENQFPASSNQALNGRQTSPDLWGAFSRATSQPGIEVVGSQPPEAADPFMIAGTTLAAIGVCLMASITVVRLRRRRGALSR